MRKILSHTKSFFIPRTESIPTIVVSPPENDRPTAPKRRDSLEDLCFERKRCQWEDGLGLLNYIPRNKEAWHVKEAKREIKELDRQIRKKKSERRIRRYPLETDLLVNMTPSPRLNRASLSRPTPVLRLPPFESFRPPPTIVPIDGHVPVAAPFPGFETTDFDSLFIRQLTRAELCDLVRDERRFATIVSVLERNSTLLSLFLEYKRDAALIDQLCQQLKDA
ncbi:hypothetical protein CVT26_011324 [Gymnopilus dilepis]|uniref:Uncharacterized protein n=1 Tax=Gymnopilus dilepis TaxID=231916 RepID=A0A409WX13_9AGAR|nr:hypothetical protein CVT26_011324 [Gymnopilus dilepis]